jgi:hypothetical protein
MIAINFLIAKVVIDFTLVFIDFTVVVDKFATAAFCVQWL